MGLASMNSQKEHSPSNVERAPVLNAAAKRTLGAWDIISQNASSVPSPVAQWLSRKKNDEK